LLQELLLANLRTEACLLCWGSNVFNPEPRTVQTVLRAQERYQKNIYLGASSLGKSYNLIADGLMDYAMDPHYTNTKIISTTQGHARANTWSTLVNFHRLSAIPLPGTVQTDFIGFDSMNRQAAMGLVAIPMGDEGKGRLQGFHPLPRPDGKGLTRVRAILDEAEEIPNGVWEGIDNMLANEDAQGSVKVSAATNPKNISSMLAQKAEPYEGWSSVDWDSIEEWDSKEGWHVTVLDAARTENVVQKRIVFPGLQTYQGYMNLVRRGTNSEAYATFARGRYPSTSAQFNIVSSYLLAQSRGVYTWLKPPVAIGSFDAAFEEGGDNPTMTTGLYGLAGSFKPAELHGQERPEITFKNGKWAIEVQQQFHIEKDNGIKMGDNLIQLATDLRIKPEFFVMDRTGNATVLHDYLLLKWGNVLGVKWGEKSTDKRILQDSTEIASDMFPDIISEMWFAFAMWLEMGNICHAPMLQTHKVFTQLAARRFSRVSKTMRRAESKIAYKLNMNADSPDESDSEIMLPHLIRMRVKHNASIMPDREKNERRAQNMKHSVVDRIEFVDVS